MIRFVFHKLLNKKWMAAALLVGNIMLSALACATPVYTRAALQRALELSFDQYVKENNQYPMRMSMKMSRLSRLSRSENELLQRAELRLSRTGEDLRLPMLLMRSYYYLNPYNAEREEARPEAGVRFTVGAMSDLQSHVNIFGQETMNTSVNADGTVDAYVPQRVMNTWRLTMGEVLTFEDILMPDGEPLRLRIAGYFLMADESDPYWVDSMADSTYRISLFVEETLFKSLFIENRDDTRVNGEWHMLYDYSALRVPEAERVMKVTDALSKYCDRNFSCTPEFTWKDNLSDFLVQAKKVRTTYIVLQVPVLTLLILFIFMVARRIADNEEAEIAVLNSRGAGRGQILGIYLLQSLFIALLAAGAGLMLAVPLARLMSSANGFLEFIRRKDLRAEMNTEAFVYAGISAGVSVLSMVLPAMRFSGASVILQREKKRKYMKNASFWHRYFIDVILLIVALYGLYSFNSRKGQLMQEVLKGGAIDPLLYLSTAAFLAGFGLLLLRLIPYLHRLVFTIGKKRWSPAMYASHRQVLGTGREQGFIMLFLAMTVASGIFNAAAARTISENDSRNIRYLNGADLIVREQWDTNLQHYTEEVGKAAPAYLEYYEPNYDKYEELKGFSSVTKVFIDKSGGSVYYNHFGSSLEHVKLMGVEPKKFGETASFDASLMPVHWYRFLNVLSARKDAVILSANFKALGISIGARIQYYTGVGIRNEGITGTVYGFVDYWPGYLSSAYEIQKDGSVTTSEKYLVLARFDTMRENWGTIPYSVFLKAESGSTQSFYEMAASRGLRLDYVHDTEAEIVSSRAGAVKQGTNGIFTVSFMISLILCTAGFLIYWISSVKNRALQFGVLRAMGMKFREIVVMLLNEQFFVSFLSIAAGYVVGLATAKLYMPLIRIAYSAADYPVPLTLVREAGDELRLFAVIALMMIAGLAVIFGIVRRLKIAEALKLGED